MRTIKLVVAYDGSCYHGYQKQKDYDTIQSILEEKLALLCGERVSIAGSGRTDAGVHALGQTVTFTTNGRIPCANIVRASRSLLPRDIVVLSAEEMPEGFHARCSACWKVYQYRVLCCAFANPFRVRYTWQLANELNLVAMNEAAALLLGTHDFSAFRSSGSVDSSPIKTIYAAAWHKEGSELVFRIAGDGFLYHMVRIMVGTLADVGAHRILPGQISGILAAKDRKQAGQLAPACGLMLMKVMY